VIVHHWPGGCPDVVSTEGFTCRLIATAECHRVGGGGVECTCVFDCQPNRGLPYPPWWPGPYYAIRTSLRTFRDLVVIAAGVGFLVEWLQRGVKPSQAGRPVRSTDTSSTGTSTEQTT